MTRVDYLKQLEQALNKLNPTAKQEALDYFQEYFDDRNDDQATISELGDPISAAQEIIANLPEDALIENQEPPRVDLTWDWKNFFKNFSFKDTKPLDFETVETPLPNFQRLNLQLEDQTLIIESWDKDSASLLSPASLDGNYQPFTFCLDGDTLLLSSMEIPKGIGMAYSDSRQKTVLKLPQKPTLDTADVRLTDANLVINNLTVDHLTVTETNDSNLSLKHITAKNWTMEAKDINLTCKDSSYSTLDWQTADCNLMLTGLNLGKGHMEIADCHLSMNQSTWQGELALEIEDSVVTLGMSQKSNLLAETDDSLLHLPQEIAAHLERDDDWLHLEYLLEGITPTLILDASDSSITVK